MKTEEILEGNKLLAEFMCLEAKPMAKGMPEITYKCKNNEGFNDWVNEYMLKYNHSWDWIMPVVEKIQVTSCDSIESDELWARVVEALMQVNIILTFSACVSFAKWYKNQPK